MTWNIQETRKSSLNLPIYIVSVCKKGCGFLTLFFFIEVPKFQMDIFSFENFQYYSSLCCDQIYMYYHIDYIRKFQGREHSKCNVLGKKGVWGYNRNRPWIAIWTVHSMFHILYGWVDVVIWEVPCGFWISWICKGCCISYVFYQISITLQYLSHSMYITTGTFT